MAVIALRRSTFLTSHIAARHFNLDLSEEHLLVQKTCRDVAERELKPIAAKLDIHHEFPAQQIEKLGELGLMAINVDRRWGGSGHDSLSMAICVEELARGCGSTAAIVSIHNCLYANLLNRCGNEEQKETFLRPFTRGSIGCFALSEPDAGTDVNNLSTTATRDGNNFILNGVKSWVTSGTVGKAAVVFATIDKQLQHKGITAFLLPLPFAGVTLGRVENKMGIRAAPVCTFTLDNVKLPQEYILGSIGDGFKIAMQQLDNARVGIAAQALGIAEAALQLAVEYSANRQAFGQTINKMQAVQLKIAEMALRLESARLLVWRAALLCDRTGRTTKETSMAKLAASEAATFITYNAIQILGGVGYLGDLPAERYYRDARVTEIYGGVSDIHRLLIGHMVIKERGF